MLVEQAVEFGAVGQGHHQARLAGVKVAQVVDLPDVFLARAMDGGRGDGQQLEGGGRVRYHLVGVFGAECPGVYVEYRGDGEENRQHSLPCPGCVVR